jgi:FkbM family methyltransferase
MVRALTSKSDLHDRELARLLDQPRSRWREQMDRRYALTAEVLAGSRPATIYPAARMGREAGRRLRAIGVDVRAFGDGDAALHGSTIDGLPVLSPAALAERHGQDVVLVASTLYDSVIGDDLKARGCDHVVPVGYLNLLLPDAFASREYDGAWLAATDPANRRDIEAAYGLFQDEESRRVYVGKLGFYLSLEKGRLDQVRSSETIYFDPTVHRPRPDEVVVDGGAFVGDTLMAFLEWSSGRYRSYHAFEPDPGNYAKLAAVAATAADRIFAVEAGLARESGRAAFLASETADSRLVAAAGAGVGSVRLVSLDEYFVGREPPTLIKMDIEGAEADALHGATKVLASGRATLAVSAYHFPSDLWKIPLLVHGLMAESTIYVRHYTREVDDTVCYAVPVR